MKIILISITLISVPITIDKCVLVENNAPFEPINSENQAEKVEKTTTEPPEKNKVQSRDSAPAKEKKAVDSPTSISVAVIGNNEQMEQLAKAQIAKIIQQKGLTIDDKKRQNTHQEIRCTVHINQSEKNIGIRSLYLVNFSLDVAVYSLSSKQKINGFATPIISEQFQLTNTQEVAAKFDTWLWSLHKDIAALL